MRRCEFCDSPVSADATVCPMCNEEIAEESLERVLPFLKRPESPEVKRANVTQRLWGVIRRPASTYRDIGQRSDAAGPLIIIILNALIIAAYYLTIASKVTTQVNVNGTLVTTSVLNTELGGALYIAAAISILPNILIGMIYLIVGAAFAHLAFKVTGGTGERGKTISIVGYSMIPVILFRLAALGLVFLVLPNYSLQTYSYAEVVNLIYASELWLTLDYLTTASFAWVGFLLIFGIREAHNTSTAWAFLVSLGCMAVLIWTFWQAH